MELHHCLIQKDASVLARFAGQKGICSLYVSPSGHKYSILQPDGKTCNHFTSTLLSAHATLLEKTLSLRNRFVVATEGNFAPFCHIATIPKQQKRSIRDSYDRVKLLKARWPNLRLIQASKASFYNESSKRFEMESLDGYARICLSFDSKMVDVCYQVQVVAGAHSEVLGIIQQQQTFPTELTPECFKYPVRLLQSVNKEEFKPSDFEEDDTSFTSQLPQNQACVTRDCSASTASSVGLLQYAHGSASKVLRETAVDIRDQVAYFSVAKPTHNRVYALHLEKNLLLECERGYFRMYQRNGTLLQQFTTVAIPLYVRSVQESDIEERFHLPPICRHAEVLLDISCANKRLAKAEKKEPNIKHGLIDDSNNSSGRFRAYADGRVRVLFSDRAILSLDTNLDTCKCLMPNGQSVTSTIQLAKESPQLREYIISALHYAQWAYATPQQRLQRHLLIQKRHAIVEHELRKIHISSNLNTGKIDNMVIGTAFKNPDRVHHLGEQVYKVLEYTARHIAEVEKLVECKSADGIPPNCSRSTIE